MQRPARHDTRYATARRPMVKDGYPQRIAMWEAIHELGSADRGELLRALQRRGYARPNGAPVDEAYCRIELTDMTKRGFLVRLGDGEGPASRMPPRAVGSSAPPPTRRLDAVRPAVGEASYSLGAIEAALDQLDPSLLPRYGSVFYSGRLAFSAPSRLYLLGLNPGGDPVGQATETVAADIQQFRTQPTAWSAYRDESWAGAPAGTQGMQPRVLHMLGRLGLAPETVPASNVVFVRSRTEAALTAEKRRLLQQCWPVHAAVLAALGIDTIACFGGTAGRWVREMLDVHDLIERYSEKNARGWTSEAHGNGRGIRVVTLTHPSRANWCNPNSDPSPLVRRMLERPAD